MQTIHNDSVVVNENSNDLQINALNKELESLRNELKSKDEMINKLMKEKFDVLTIDVISNKKQVKRVISNTDGDLKITINSYDANTQVNNEVENNIFIQVAKKSKPTNRSITTVGDSTIKDCQAYKMKKRLAKDEKIYIKSFPGATVEDMKDYVRPMVRHQPDLIILHVGTNDLRNEKSAKNIASDIMRLGLEMKTDVNDVMISGITSRGDSLNEKAIEVNTIDCSGRVSKF